MTRAAILLLAAGVLLFVGVLASQGLTAVLATLALAGWGLIAVALFHLLPLVLDAAAIRVLLAAGVRRAPLADALLARWIGESVNSLMPAGQIGGPLVMIRQLTQRGTPTADAAAAITVSTTFQTFAQIVFALMGVALLGEHAGHTSQGVAAATPVLLATSILALLIAGFYVLQRRGLFGKVMRLALRFAGNRDWSLMPGRADAIDGAVQSTYGRRVPVAASFGLSLLGWVAGTGEVWLVLWLLGSAVSWSDALLLESLGQAIRGAAFAVPGSLGVQEGGYLLLAPLASLRPDVALALSLAKRARELLLAAPGLVYLHISEQALRRRASHAPASE
jgi:putative membrane protein